MLPPLGRSAVEGWTTSASLVSAWPRMFSLVWTMRTSSPVLAETTATPLIQARGSDSGEMPSPGPSGTGRRLKATYSPSGLDASMRGGGVVWRED